MSEVIGSWKIIEMRSPRSVAQRVRSKLEQIVAVETGLAAGDAPGRLRQRPMMDSAVTLLPQPDSPTMPSVRPASTREADAVDRRKLSAFDLK